MRPNTTEASGGTTYGTKGFVPPGKGSGGWIVFDTSKSATVSARVAISYVSPENAEANLRAENPSGTTFDTVRKKAHAAWNDALNRIQIEGGTHRRASRLLHGPLPHTDGRKPLQRRRRTLHGHGR